MTDINQQTAEEIANAALGIAWWDTESAARRVAEHAAAEITRLRAKVARADALADASVYFSTAFVGKNSSRLLKALANYRETDT